MADKFFVGYTSDEWSVASNWSLTSGGAGGAGRPSFSDNAHFDVNSPDCTIDISAGVRGMILDAGFANTFYQGVGLAFSVGTNGWNQAGGTFVGSDSDLTLKNVPDKFIISGGSFTSTSAVLTQQTNGIDFSGGTFIHNGGTLRCTNSSSRSLDFGGNPLHIFDLAASGGTITTVGTTVVEKLLLIPNSMTMSGGSIQVDGDVDIASPSLPGTTLLILSGAGTHTFKAVSVPGGDVVCNEGFWDATALDIPFDASGQDFSLTGTGVFCIGDRTLTVQGDLTDNAPAAHIQRFDAGVITVAGTDASNPAIVTTCSQSPQVIHPSSNGTQWVHCIATLDLLSNQAAGFNFQIVNTWVGTVKPVVLGVLKTYLGLTDLTQQNARGKFYSRAPGDWYGSGDLT